MGSFLFEWHHPASEVFVTGTFDNWAKTEQLSKVDGEGGHFAKLVKLPSATDKVFYKFVVDGTWTTDHTAPTENDSDGNANNVLYEKDIAAGTHGASASALAASTIGGVGAGATTAALAGQQPLEKDVAKGEDDKMPGAFPDPTPADEGIATPPIFLYPGDIVPDYSTYHSATHPVGASSDIFAAQNPTEQALGVAPIPASSGFGNPVKLAPGEPVPHSSTLSSNTVDGGVSTDKASYENSGSTEQEQVASVNPIPASAGFGNPVTLAPGEPVPHPSTLHSNTVDSNVTTDKESYEKSGSSLLGAGVVGGTLAAGAAGVASMFGVPALTKNTIPESSLPMGGDAKALETDNGPFIQSSAGTGTSTAALAGQVPLEPRGVPQVVEESQEAAHASPEASASPEAVQEKSAVESELLSKVPEQKAVGETDTSNKGWVAGGIAAGVAAVGGAAAYAGVPKSVQDKIQSMSPSTPATTTTAEDVPQVVHDSIAKAGTGPEAAANEEAVLEKKAVESELLKRDAAPSATITDPTSIPAIPAAAAADSSHTPVIADQDTMPAIAMAHRDGPAPTSFESAKENEPIAAGSIPVAAGAAGATAAGTAATAATTTEPAKNAAVAATAAEDKKRQVSRDVSPFSRPDGSSASPSTPTKSSAAAASTSAGSTPVASGSASKDKDDAKAGKRRSKMSGWFKETFGSSKSKK